MTSRQPQTSTVDATSSPASRSDVDALLAACRMLVAVSVRSVARVDSKVTLPELRVLVVVASRGTASLSSVADGTGVHLSKASRMCDRLTRRGLLSRRDDPEDRRTLRLSLTAAGARIVEQVQQERREELVPMLDRMPAARRSLLAELLRELLDSHGVAEEELWALGWVT